MRTIQVNLFKFNELTEDIQKKVIEKNWLINVEHDWWQSTYEDSKRIGLEIKTFDLDRNRHAKGRFLLAANEVAQNILNEHGDICETFKTATEFMSEWQPVFNEYMDENSEHYESSDHESKLQEIEEEFLNSLLEDYALMLEKECDYLQSKEAIVETILANDYEFTENGDIA